MYSSNQQRLRARFYRDNGYLRLPEVLDHQETKDYREFVTQEWLTDQATSKVARTGQKAAKVYDLYGRDSQLMHRLVAHPKLVDNLTNLLGPNVVFVRNRHNHGTLSPSSAAGEPEGLHRDILQATRGLLSAVVYLEPSTIDNGCTYIIPSSHNLDFVGVPQVDGGGTWMAEHQEYQGLEDQALPVPMPAGGVLLFNGLAFHQPSLNNGDKTRISITLGYRSVDELAYTNDPDREVLVAGEFIYRGNDR
jgi:ectoine hydroxylase-related dioxygenase (phytanoyl-CoA dioxygenase family)